jgi:transposase
MDLIYGIDIASEEFVVYNEDRGCFDCENKKKPISAFLKTLPEGAIIALEATGGYGKLLADTAVEKGFTVYMLQPVRIKRFREAGPERNKSDKIDAMEIHEYVGVFRKRLHPYQPLPEFEAKLRKLSRVRDGIVAKTASIRLLLKCLEESPKAIEKMLWGLEAKARELLSEIESMIAQAEDAKVLSGIVSVGPCTIASLLPILRTVPFKGKYSLDKFVGMDMVMRESGKLRGKRRLSKQGDKRVRKALYMAAMSAASSKAWKPYYEWLLKTKNLAKIAALVALARKILHTIYGVYRTQKAFVAPRWVDIKP